MNSIAYSSMVSYGVLQAGGWLLTALVGSCLQPAILKTQTTRSFSRRKPYGFFFTFDELWLAELVVGERRESAGLDCR